MTWRVEHLFLDRLSMFVLWASAFALSVEGARDAQTRARFTFRSCFITLHERHELVDRSGSGEVEHTFTFRAEQESHAFRSRILLLLEWGRVCVL